MKKWAALKGSQHYIKFIFCILKLIKIVICLKRLSFLIVIEWAANSVALCFKDCGKNLGLKLKCLEVCSEKGTKSPKYQKVMLGHKNGIELE